MLVDLLRILEVPVSNLLPEDRLTSLKVLTSSYLFREMLLSVTIKQRHPHSSHFQINHSWSSYYSQLLNV